MDDKVGVEVSRDVLFAKADNNSTALRGRTDALESAGMLEEAGGRGGGFRD